METVKYIGNVLEENFIPYAGEILLNNLPSVADGLLASQRKVVYALHKNGVTYDKSHIKLLRASAMAMTYYIYGDMPLNKVMKNMGNNSLNYMYLDPKGSFGDKQKRDGVGASARYIECKLSQYSEELLKGIRKGIVPTKRNFDNTEDEPLVLPSALPNVLLNTSQSIAVGESSKIPAHNLNEVCDCFINYLKTSNIDSSIDMLQGCDLSLGGQVVYDKDTFRKIYTTGKGSFTLVGKYKYDKKENSVTIYEIPYETYIEVIEEKIRQQFDKGLFKEISDIHDGSDKDGLKLSIYLKKNTNIDLFISKLRKYTPFETTMSCNFTLLDIDNKTPKLMSLEDIIKSWTEHRKQCIRKELSYDLDKLRHEYKMLQGLRKLLDDIDQAIKIIRQTSSDEETITKLMEYFTLDKEQAEYIAETKLRNLNKTWIEGKTKRLEEVAKKGAETKAVLENEEKILQIIIAQLEEGKKKFGKPRMTEVIYDDKKEEIKVIKEDLIEEYNCYITLTREGYLKKTKLASDSHKVKDGDEVLQQLSSTNKSSILLFSNKGNMYTVKCHQLQQVAPSVLGTYIPTIVELEQEEQIIYMVSTLDFVGSMIFGFANGKVAKITLSSYNTIRTKLQNAYSNVSPLVHISLEEDRLMVAKSSIDKVLIFNHSSINAKSSRSSQGNSVLKSRKDSVMQSLSYIPIDLDEKIIEYYKASTNSVGKNLRKTEEGII